MRALYRIGQGLQALSAGLRPVDDALAAQHLEPPLYALYRQMRRSERQHSVRVLRALLDDGQRDPDLLAAALLHDVGKSRAPFNVWDKTLVVLVKAIAPGRFAAWGSAPARGWRRPFAVSVQHPAWGAEMVAAVGGTPRTVRLIARHADPVPDPPAADDDRLLRALQAVDDES